MGESDRILSSVE